MNAFKVTIICVLSAILAGCAVTPCGYGCQSGYYSRPIYYTQAIYPRSYYTEPYLIAGWHHEHRYHNY